MDKSIHFSQFDLHQMENYKLMDPLTSDVQGKEDPEDNIKDVSSFLLPDELYFFIS